MSRVRAPSPRVVMWGAIGGSVVLLGVLLLAGLDQGAWVVASAALLVACVLVCVWAGVQGRITEREVRRAVERLAASRRARERSRRPGTPFDEH